MTQNIIDQLLADNPKLHTLSAEHAELLGTYGVRVEPGAANHAVPPEVLRYFAKVVKPDHLTVETGGGYTTVALTSLARHHTCVTIDRECVELTREYMSRVGLPENKVTFMVESSDTALPKLPEDARFDFAFIDGNHAYPFPAVDWHYLDLRLKVGGLLGLDNTEIRAVYDQCRFLEENQTYELVDRFENHAYGRRYGASFYRKLKDDGRETFNQPYNLRPARRTPLRKRLGDIRWRRRKVWPWD